LVLMQDRANVSADFLELMKQEIIEVIKKYIDVDEKEIDVHLTNKANEDGTVGAPALYANIPIITIKNDARKIEAQIEKKEEPKKEEIIEKEKIIKEEIKEETENIEENNNIENEEQKEKIKEAEESTKKNEENNIEEKHLISQSEKKE